MENEPLDIGQFKNGPEDESTQATKIVLEKRLAGVVWAFYGIAAVTFASFMLVTLHIASLFRSGLQRVTEGPLRYMTGDWFVGRALSHALFIGLFIFLGVKLSRKKAWALSAGVVVYAVDVLPLVVTRRDWVDVAIHGIFMFLLVRGFAVLRDMQHLAGPRGL